jgi:hypothetical protein
MDDIGMEDIGIVAAVAAIFTAGGSVFAVHWFRGLRKTQQFVAASATDTVVDFGWPVVQRSRR